MPHASTPHFYRTGYKLGEKIRTAALATGQQLAGAARSAAKHYPTATPCCFNVEQHGMMIFLYTYSERLH